MSVMKLGEVSESYAAASFSFPNNPKKFSVPLENNNQTQVIPFGKTHVTYGSGGVGVRQIILVGEFFGTSKLTNFNSLGKHIHDNAVKKFWIDSTNFYYVMGVSLKEDLQGGRTNFIDFVCALNCVLPYVYGASSTYSVGLTSNAKTVLQDSLAGSTGSFDNSGSAPSFVTWSIANAGGSSVITKIEIGDTSDFATSPHHILWTGSLAAGSTLDIEVFSYVSEGSRGTYKVMRFGYSSISGTESGDITLTGGEMPWVNVGVTDQSFSIQINGASSYTGTATVTATWNEANIG